LIIQVRGLRKKYGDNVALNDLDLEIEAGGVVGILGPNGAGKTTLVETMEGLRQPTAGTVSVLGMDPTRHGAALRERLGVQLQQTALPTELTVREMLDLFGAFYAAALPADSILEKVNLLSQADQRAATLSGGQQQRLVVGIALIHDPELVILDEPTTGLDPKARRDLHGVIRELREQGRTTLLTTHYIEEAEHLCDRVIMIRGGEIVADGTPFDLVGQSSESSTIWIHVDGDMDPAPLIAAGVEPIGQQGEHHKFATTDPTATVLALGDMLRSQGLRLVDLRLKRPTLEDVYLELMGDVTDDGDLASDVHTATGATP
jgi:ABC-2 type transport system ATP-binding protein